MLFTFIEISLFLVLQLLYKGIDVYLHLLFYLDVIEKINYSYMLTHFPFKLLNQFLVLRRWLWFAEA